MYKAYWKSSFPCSTFNHHRFIAFRELKIRKTLLGIKDYFCVFCQSKNLYAYFLAGIMKIELKLATYLEMHNAEKKWWKCLTDPCPKLSSFWYACSHIWQCCWEPQRILRYLPIIVPSGHLKSAFIWYWSFSSCCLVTREAFQDAKPKFTSPLAQECFWFLYAVAIMCTSGKSPVGWSRDYLIRLVLHALCLNWMLLITPVFFLLLLFSHCKRLSSHQCATQ